MMKPSGAFTAQETPKMPDDLQFQLFNSYGRDLSQLEGCGGKSNCKGDITGALPFPFSYSFQAGGKKRAGAPAGNQSPQHSSTPQPEHMHWKYGTAQQGSWEIPSPWTNPSPNFSFDCTQPAIIHQNCTIDTEEVWPLVSPTDVT